jgi:hypothetical protein
MRVREQSLMKCRYQGRALSSRGDIATPEIGNHPDSGEFYQQRGIA